MGFWHGAELGVIGLHLTFIVGNAEVVVGHLNLIIGFYLGHAGVKSAAGLELVFAERTWELRRLGKDSMQG